MELPQPPDTESELVESGLRFLKAGLDPRQVIEMVVSGAKLIGFRLGSDCAMKAMEEVLSKV